MAFRNVYIIVLWAVLSLTGKAQYVTNDVGLRLSLSAQKKINDQFTISGKLLSRQVENFRNLNRVYVRLGLAYSLGEHVETELRLYYMYGRKGFKDFTNSYRYSLALIYKTKLNERFSFSNRLTYQITNNYLIADELADDKTGGVVRDRMTLKFKHTRRGSAYVKEEGLWQVTGKKERYFGRNRVYLGYEYKLSDKWDLDAYFILERTHGGTSAESQERNFFYGINLGYNF
jgi:hypothetical protein